MPEPVSRFESKVHIAILALAIVLRVLFFPHADETMDVDEVGYLKGSLALLEGLPAGYKAAPAGPNLWVGWCYAGGVAAYHLLLPGPEEHAVPLAVRPFVALDHALFDQYRDLTHLHALWIITQLLLSVWATSAAWRIGRARGGLAGGVLLGGYLAVLPLFVEFTEMSRPYMTAWSFGLLALQSATLDNGRWRERLAGLFLGLAIASRVEMLLFAPVVLWEFWDRPEPRTLMVSWLRTVGFSIAAALLAAPWLLTHLIGNLRTIATVRLGENPLEKTSLGSNLIRFGWTQGLLGAMLALLLGIICIVVPGMLPRGQPHRIRVAFMAIYVLMLLATLAKGTVYLHQQGPVVLALIVFSTFATDWSERRWPRFAYWFVITLLLIPLGQTFAMMHKYHRLYAPNPSTDWIAAHVPAGTLVYTQYELRDPLPTPESSTAIWSEVTNDQAWRKKFMSGMQRFHVSDDQIPLALSEENLVQDRGNAREYFILGGRTHLPEPRFDVRIYNGSMVFGVQNVQQAFAQTGGVMVWFGSEKPKWFGEPVVQWVSLSGYGIFIYCSQDVKAHLKPD